MHYLSCIPKLNNFLFVFLIHMLCIIITIPFPFSKGPNFSALQTTTPIRSPYAVPGFHPSILFPWVSDIVHETRYAFTNHIAVRHLYKSLNDRWFHMQRNADPYIKSVFDDVFDDEMIIQHIIETIKRPTYIVEFQHQRFCVMKR